MNTPKYIFMFCIYYIITFALSGCFSNESDIRPAMQERLKLTIEEADKAILKDAAALIPANAYTEVPMWFYEVNGVRKGLIQTGFTNVVDIAANKNIMTDQDALSNQKLISWGDSNDGLGLKDPASLDPKTYWKRNYYGIMGTSVVQSASNGSCVIAIMHGENKNEMLGSVKYDNTIKPAQEYQDTDYSGYGTDGKYYDDFKNYFAFVSMTYSPINEKEGNAFMDHDMGPILWPSMGYLQSNKQQASGGLRHPSMIIHDGYIYIFYVEECSIASEEGRAPGIKLARAPLNTMGMPGNFMNYYNGSFSEKSLPDGFSRENKYFFETKGGKSSPVIGDCYAIRFSVAKVKNSTYFIGVEERVYPDNKIELYLRVSTDLIHWTNGKRIPRTLRENWDKGVLHYPIFSNVECTNSMTIDPSEFYVWGTENVPGSSAKLQSIKLKVKIEGNTITY